jgi:hypothetical protein
VRRTEALARHCLTRCGHCRIFLLTHCRNHRQLHLVCCPFGCRAERDRRDSIQRSGAYYKKHPERKRIQNQRRYRLGPSPSGRGPAAGPERQNPRADSPPIHSRGASVSEPAEGAPGGSDPDPPPQCPPELIEVLPKAADPEVIGYVRVIVSLIEGRRVSLEEIWQSLLNFSRQRPIARERKIDQTVDWLNANPP